MKAMTMKTMIYAAMAALLSTTPAAAAADDPLTFPDFFTVKEKAYMHCVVDQATTALRKLAKRYPNITAWEATNIAQLAITCPDKGVFTGDHENDEGMGDHVYWSIRRLAGTMFRDDGGDGEQTLDWDRVQQCLTVVKRGVDCPH